jgi:hypothetical protein
VQPADTKQKDEGAIKLCSPNCYQIPMSKEFYNCNSDFSLIPHTSNQFEVFQQTHIKFSKLHRLFKRKKNQQKEKKKKKNFTWVLEIQKLGSP